MQKCNVHNIDLKCMGGCSAHPSNWYCPECEKIEIPYAGDEPVKKRGNDSLCDEFISIVNLAAEMLERDDRPARTEMAKDLRNSAGVIIEKLRAI